VPPFRWSNIRQKDSPLPFTLHLKTPTQSSLSMVPGDQTKKPVLVLDDGF